MKRFPTPSAGLFRLLFVVGMNFYLVGSVNAQANETDSSEQRKRLDVQIVSLNKDFFDRIGVDVGWGDRFTISDIEAYFLLSGKSIGEKQFGRGFQADGLWYSLPAKQAFRSQYALITNCRKTKEGDSRLKISGLALSGHQSITESNTLERGHVFCMLLDDLDNKDRGWFLRFTR